MGAVIPFRIGNAKGYTAADKQAYDAYCYWCSVMGMKPAPLATYIIETATINHAPIGWSATK